ncbi:MAG TPA: Gfo/Idh/MocA family oxidoreductase [Solirubrobacterales bacterium]|jgi:predicted dehydrogenase
MSEGLANGSGNGNGNGRRIPGRSAAWRALGVNGNGAGPDAVRVGVVGLGYWGPNLVRVLADLEDVELTWVCDRDPDRLAKVARRYPAVRATCDLGDLLADGELDAIAIATPVGTHAALARAALSAGKHTFVEKPLAASVEEAESLAALAAERGLVLLCGHTFTYSPPVRAVKRLLDEGELGELYFVSSSRVNLGLHQRDVSVIWDLGPHDFSILRYWLGSRPDTVAAAGRDAVVHGIADVAFLSLRFGTGTLANIEISWLAPSKLRRTVLVGSEKMVVYEDGAPEPVRVFDKGVVYHDPETFGEYHLSYRTGDIVSPHLEGSEPLAVELADFAAAVREGESRTAQLELALDVVRTIEAAEASLNDSGRPVPVGRPLDRVAR